MVGFIFYFGRTKAGCSIYFILPVLLFTITILLIGVLRTDVVQSLSALGSIVGVILSMDRSVRLAVPGLFMVGVSLSFSPNLFQTGAYITLAVVLVRLLMTRNVPRLFLLLSILIPLLSLSLLGNYRGGILSNEERTSTANLVESEKELFPEEGLTKDATVLTSRPSSRGSADDFDFLVLEEVAEVRLIDSVFLFGFYTIALILVIVVSRKAILEMGRWSRLIPPSIVLLSIVAVLIGGFMYLRSLPLSEEIVLGTGGPSNQTSFAPSQSVTGLPEENEEDEPEAILNKSAAYNILRWSTLAGILLLSALLAYFVTVIARKNQTVSSTLKSKDTILTEVRQSASVPPKFSEDREFIISSYKWLREFYFEEYCQLTPFELIQETEASLKHLLIELTEIYVPVKYGNLEPEIYQCREFHKLLLGLKELLDRKKGTFDNA
ncbi:MAG: hypothetical protein H7A28_07130 [Thermotogae bacterium]|nr:hypothetical protein [Thermotogota bacterium]